VYMLRLHLCWLICSAACPNKGIDCSWAVEQKLHGLHVAL